VACHRRSVMTNRVPSQDGVAERFDAIRTCLEGRGVDRIGRSPNWSTLRGRPNPSGFLSWAPRQSRMVVRHHRSVMTNRMLLQNSIAERSTVLRIRLESSGCRPNHPASVSGLARVAGGNRGGRPAGSPAMVPEIGRRCRPAAGQVGARRRSKCQPGCRHRQMAGHGVAVDPNRSQTAR